MHVTKRTPCALLVCVVVACRTEQEQRTAVGGNPEAPSTYYVHSGIVHRLQLHNLQTHPRTYWVCAGRITYEGTLQTHYSMQLSIGALREP